MEQFVQFSEALRNFVLAGAAAAGAWIAWERIPRERSKADVENKQADYSRKDQAWKLFNSAVTQIGDAKLEVRLGAIFTLNAIATDFEELSQPVIEFPTAYLRQRAPDYGDGDPPPDVREIMRIIRNESHSQNDDG
jgi:hypothetical protein